MQLRTDEKPPMYAMQLWWVSSTKLNGRHQKLPPLIRLANIYNLLNNIYDPLKYDVSSADDKKKSGMVNEWHHVLADVSIASECHHGFHMWRWKSLQKRFGCLRIESMK